jgi:hypothetical protein
VDLAYRWRLGKLWLNSRRAEVRCCTVESSTGMGFPSAFEGARLVEEALDWKRGGKEKGRECRRGFEGPGSVDAEAAAEGGG